MQSDKTARYQYHVVRINETRLRPREGRPVFDSGYVIVLLQLAAKHKERLRHETLALFRDLNFRSELGCG